MKIKVNYTNNEGEESQGLLVTAFYQENVRCVVGFVAKSDGTFDTVPINRLYHKNTFI